MTRRRALLTPFIAVALALATGCGGDEPAARPRDGRMAIVLDDFRFVPQRIRAGRAKLTFELRNRGRLAHTFRLRFEGRAVVEVPSLLPGERATKTVGLPRGNYRMFCALANHEELGMYGTLTVR
jgi:plastocyanin